MTIEDYQRLTAELGINRGALVSGFTFELPSVVAANREPHTFKKNKGAIIKPDAVDLSHLNPPEHAHGKRGGSVKKNRGNRGAARGRLPS